MATKVHMEALSPTMEEGQVVKWLKAEGEAVSRGEILAEIETDKATMELTARGDGVLRRILTPEGGTAPVGEVIAVIASAEEDIEGLVGQIPVETAPEETPVQAPGSAVSQTAAPDREAVTADRESQTPAHEAATEAHEAATEAHGVATQDRETDSGPEAPAGDGERVRASPIARRLAAEAGIDLRRVEGSGPHGRVIKRDIEVAKTSVPVAPPPPAPGAPPALPTVDTPAAAYQDIPLNQMRKTIARRLTESIGPVPHFFLTVDVDMGRLVEARRTVNALLERDGVKVSVNDFVLKATAAALVRHPACNAAWMGDSIRRYSEVHLGVAVAVEDGLITPVVRNADRKGLARIGSEVKEMAARAQEKKLKPDEYTGATFSVSNLGMFGIEEFTAVINPPEAGILAVGRMEERPVAVDGAVVVRPRMRLTMSCDHRVIDGATGARFLQTLTAMLEEPSAILA